MSPLELLRPHEWAAIRHHLTADLLAYTYSETWQNLPREALERMSSQVHAADDCYGPACTARRALAAHLRGATSVLHDRGFPGHPDVIWVLQERHGSTTCTTPREDAA